MKNTFKLILVLGLVFGLMLPLAVGAAQKTKIIIGTAISTTGKFSTEGTDSYRGTQLWVEEVNAKGGIFVKDIGKKLPIEWIVYDDKSDASTCAKMYDRLITVDKVDFLLPPWGSGNTFAATAVTEKHKYPMIMGSAAAEKIYERGFKYIFETAILPKTSADLPIDFLATRKQEFKKLAVLYENFLFTLALKDSTEKRLKEKGLDSAMSEMYPLGATDFSSILVKVKALNPDALILLNLMPSSIYFTRQMHEIGIKPNFYLVNIGPNFRKEFIEGLGDLSENVLENSMWHWDLPYKGAKEVAERYEKKNGRMPNSDVIHPYMAGQILEQAIEKAGTLDREKVAMILRSEEFQTVGGLVKYDKTGVNIHQKGAIAQVQNGKRVLVYPEELATAKMRLPYRK
jgi:branched-chain amino acid transport system substrate-binding protein